MLLEHGLSPGQTISDEELARIFKCSTQGGMRRSLKTRTLVIISDHTATISPPCSSSFPNPERKH